MPHSTLLLHLRYSTGDDILKLTDMTHLPPKGSIIRHSGHETATEPRTRPPESRGKCLHKLGEYRNNGIYPGKNLITLFTHYDHRLNKSDL